MYITWKETCGFQYNKTTLDEKYSADRYLNGVYIIWSQQNGRVIYVGSGDIDRLWRHLNKRQITQYSKLAANYAVIPGNNSDIWRGIERYLADVYNPLVGERYPADVDSIEVNVPDCFE